MMRRRRSWRTLWIQRALDPLRSDGMGSRPLGSRPLLAGGLPTPGLPTPVLRLSSQIDVNLGAEEHRAIVVGGGVLQERRQLLLDFAVEHRPPVRDYFD